MRSWQRYGRGYCRSKFISNVDHWQWLGTMFFYEWQSLNPMVHMKNKSIIIWCLFRRILSKGTGAELFVASTIDMDPPQSRRRSGKQPDAGAGKAKAKSKAKVPNIAPLLDAENASLSSSGAPSWNPNNMFHTNWVQLGINWFEHISIINYYRLISCPELGKTHHWRPFDNHRSSTPPSVRSARPSSSSSPSSSLLIHIIIIVIIIIMVRSQPQCGFVGQHIPCPG